MDANFIQITQVIEHPLGCVLLHPRKPSYSLHRIGFSTLGGIVSPGREMVGCLQQATIPRPGFFQSRDGSAYLSTCFCIAANVCLKVTLLLCMALSPVFYQS